jgi:8-oxo-dGTP pyrophosphatase MutT (NUDIX family)/transcriptional regulator with XRE-family HTH domain
VAPDDTSRKNPLGPVGAYVVANLKRLRDERRLSYRELSDALARLGRPIPTLGLSRIERGERRVDADDLVALALALGVNPSALLLPRDVPPDSLVSLADDWSASATDAWAWADGRRPLPVAGPFTRSNMDIQAAMDFASHARPEWAPPPETLQAMGISLRRPIVAAIVTSSEGVLITARKDGKPPWGFVTGEVEPGELAEDTAVREVKEETGLEVRAGRVIGERNPHPVTGRHMIYMAAKPTRGTSVFVGDEAELAEVRWVSVAEADELLPGMYEKVREHLARELGGAGEG